MTAEELRTRVLGLIRTWARSPLLKENKVALEILNALAGDIEVIDLDE